MDSLRIFDHLGAASVRLKMKLKAFAAAGPFSKGSSIRIPIFFMRRIKRRIAAVLAAMRRPCFKAWIAANRRAGCPDSRRLRERRRSFATTPGWRRNHHARRRTSPSIEAAAHAASDPGWAGQACPGQVLEIERLLFENLDQSGNSNLALRAEPSRWPRRPRTATGRRGSRVRPRAPARTRR